MSIVKRMNNKKLTYKEIREKQKSDMRDRKIHIDIYRNFSTPFTWAFIKLGISPNTITILSYFLCIIGAFFLAKGTYVFLFIGLLFFVLFRILDDSDGEIARLQKSESIKGVYFDRVSHYIYNFFLGLGLGIGLDKLYQHDFFLILGLLFGLVYIIEDVISDVMKYLIRQEIINKEWKKNLSVKSLMNLDKKCHKSIMDKVNSGKTWDKSNIFVKIFSIFPLQGIIYKDRFNLIILVVLIIFEYYLQLTSNIPSFLEQIGIMSPYIIIVIISKTIWITNLIFRLEKNRYITKTINRL